MGTSQLDSVIMMLKTLFDRNRSEHLIAFTIVDTSDQPES